MKTVAISACLLGEKCRYDGSSNKNALLLDQLKGVNIVAFCPEDEAFGTPRPTMDLVKKHDGYYAICNETRNDLSPPIIAYANTFFTQFTDIDLVIGKDRSPSCGVTSTKLYDEKKVLLSTKEAGLMIKQAKKRGLRCVDAEDFQKDFL